MDIRHCVKVGAKIYPDRINEIPGLGKIADYIELKATKELNPAVLKKFSMPITIHASDVNPAAKSAEKLNMKMIKKAQKAADRVGSDVIIVHPGDLVDENNLVDNAVSFFKRINDKRIIFENLTFTKSLCRTPEEVLAFKKETGADFCLDFGHAIAIAAQLKKNYKPYLKEFVKLKPVYFHICDGHINSGIDEHLDFWKGDYDLDYLKHFIGNKRVTLETNKPPIEILKKQIAFLKK